MVGGKRAPKAAGRIINRPENRFRLAEKCTCDRFPIRNRLGTARINMQSLFKNRSEMEKVAFQTGFK